MKLGLDDLRLTNGSTGQEVPRSYICICSKV